MVVQKVRGKGWYNFETQQFKNLQKQQKKFKIESI